VGTVPINIFVLICIDLSVSGNGGIVPERLPLSKRSLVSCGGNAGNVPTSCKLSPISNSSNDEGNTDGMVPERSIFLAENLTIVEGNGGTVPLIVLSPILNSIKPSHNCGIVPDILFLSRRIFDNFLAKISFGIVPRMS